MTPRRSSYEARHPRASSVSATTSRPTRPRAVRTVRRRGGSSTSGFRISGDPPPCTRPGRSGRRRPFDVVHDERVLVTHVQPAIRDDRMRPAWKALVGDVEAPLFAIAGRRGFRQPDDIVLALDVEVAVGERHGSLADAAIAPHDLA